MSQSKCLRDAISINKKTYYTDLYYERRIKADTVYKNYRVRHFKNGWSRGHTYECLVRLKQVGPYILATPVVKDRKIGATIMFMNKHDNLRLVCMVVDIYNCNYDNISSDRLPNYATHRSKFQDIVITCTGIDE